MHGDLGTAFLLTLFAGLSTGIGGLVVLLSRRPDLRLLSFGLGFSGGVMVFISLAELLPAAEQMLAGALDSQRGRWVALACFFGGILLSRALDALVPDATKNPHEAVPIGSLDCLAAQRAAGNEVKTRSLARVGVLTTLAIALHNIPEGLATLVTSLSDAKLGLSVALAVAIHNIPEGISVAVLVFFATSSRKKAILFALATGLAEPIGAISLYAFFSLWLSPVVIGGTLAAVAGIMVFISFDELLPTAREYDTGHMEISGVIAGMAVMAVGLTLV